MLNLLLHQLKQEAQYKVVTEREPYSHSQHLIFFATYEWDQ